MTTFPVKIPCSMGGQSRARSAHFHDWPNVCSDQAIAATEKITQSDPTSQNGGTDKSAKMGMVGGAYRKGR